MAARMQKFLTGLAVVCALSLPVPVRAADSTTLGVGTGAVAGALVGGPIGAVVGAVAGGVIGANSDGVRRGLRRRPRVAHRRGFTARPARARMSAPDPIRPVSTTSPARLSGSEAGARRASGTQRETDGASWRDPH